MKGKLVRIILLLFITTCLAIFLAVLSIVIVPRHESQSQYPIQETAEIEPIEEPIVIDSAYARVLAGEVLFKENCKSCHAIHTIEVGPALHGVSSRRSKKWMNQVVRNFEVLLAKKDTAAINLFEKYNRIPHTTFESFTDKEIDDIFIYIDEQPHEQPVYYLPEVID